MAVLAASASGMLDLEITELLLQRVNAAGITSKSVGHEAEKQPKKTNEHYI